METNVAVSALRAARDQLRLRRNQLVFEMRSDSGAWIALHATCQEIYNVDFALGLIPSEGGSVGPKGAA